MKKLFCVKKRTLLLIAGIVWLIAGFNVARLGIISYSMIDRSWYLYLLSMVVFLLFGRMFYKMSKKHTKRIIGYENDRPFWHFFDLKAYLIMTCMMSGGGSDLEQLEYFRTYSLLFSIPDLFSRCDVYEKLFLSQSADRKGAGI